MRRAGFFSAAWLLTAAFAVPAADLHGRQHPDGKEGGATCDPARIDPASYRLTTEAQALNALRPREPWWEPFGLWKSPREIGTVNEGAATLAKRAKELDDTNLLAHGQLAREYVTMAVDRRTAEDEWQRVLDSGGAIVWTATLYEIDPRSIFVLAFDRTSIRIYQLDQLAGELDTHFGAPEIPGPERVAFWRALGGCLPPDVAPEAEIGWHDVREIGGGSWTLRFELAQKVRITSDRGKRRSDDSLEVALHGQGGFMDYRFVMTRFGPRRAYHGPVDPGPLLFQERVRQMLVAAFDPQARIKLPKLNRGFGW